MISSNRELVNYLLENGVLKTPAIIEAFLTIDRRDFVSENLQYQSYENIALPLDHGQTISQPWTVAFMLELLQPISGHKVLDIGSGSGYQAALLAQIVGPAGQVISLDIIPELKARAMRNCYKYDFIKKGILEFHCLNAVAGYSQKAPFDRIISAASSSSLPVAWLKQLKISGRLLMPKNSDIYLLEKITTEKFRDERYAGFSFVPFVDR